MDASMMVRMVNSAQILPELAFLIESFADDSLSHE